MLMVTLMMASRGAGDAVTPLRFMILSVALDIVLNPVLILGLGPFPRLGIAGSAPATASAGTISLAAMPVWFYAKDHVLRLRGRELRSEERRVGKSVSDRVRRGGRRIIKQKTKK